MNRLSSNLGGSIHERPRYQLARRRWIQPSRCPKGLQPGADVRGEPVPTKNFELPEGLKRQRMGPYDRDKGRGDVPAHVPKPGATADKN